MSQRRVKVLALVCSHCSKMLDHDQSLLPLLEPDLLDDVLIVVMRMDNN